MVNIVSPSDCCANSNKFKQIHFYIFKNTVEFILLLDLSQGSVKCDEIKTHDKFVRFSIGLN